MSRRTTPSLRALRAFEAAARLGGVARAAEELGVSPAAISQQVSGLEATLELELFVRERGRMRLTDAGRRYAEAVGAGLDRIEAATLDVRSHRGQRRLTVGGLPSLTTAWLIPRLPRFEAYAAASAGERPAPQLHVVTLELNFASAERAPDLAGGRIDVGLFYGDGHWAGVSATRLTDETLIAVAAPANPGDPSASRARPRSAQAIDGRRLLQHSTRPEAWAAWSRAGGIASRRPDGPSFEHFYMLIEAARAGLGVALVPRMFVRRELERGQLVQVSGHTLASERAYWIVHEPKRAEDPDVRTLVDWLQLEAQRDD